MKFHSGVFSGLFAPTVSVPLRNASLVCLIKRFVGAAELLNLSENGVLGV